MLACSFPCQYWNTSRISNGRKYLKLKKDIQALTTQLQQLQEQFVEVDTYLNELDEPGNCV